MSDVREAPLQRRYAASFLADSFCLSLEQAREILASVDRDRTAAADGASKAGGDL
jgi:hypothetical protein